MPTGRTEPDLQLKSGRWHLTIRSSRDRFAARLTRYRVPPRQAAARSGLTQVLGRITISLRTINDKHVSQNFVARNTATQCLCNFNRESIKHSSEFDIVLHIYKRHEI